MRGVLTVALERQTQHEMLERWANVPECWGSRSWIAGLTLTKFLKSAKEDKRVDGEERKLFYSALTLQLTSFQESTIEERWAALYNNTHDTSCECASLWWVNTNQEKALAACVCFPANDWRSRVCLRHYTLAEPISPNCANSDGNFLEKIFFVTKTDGQPCYI